MKRISCLLLSLLLALLCACGGTDTHTPSDQTESDGGEGPSAVPAVCALYYDYAGLEVIAPADSKLPLAAGASHGAPDYLPLWHNGEYGQLAASGGEGYTVPELTDGRASEEGAYGRFCWNGELYYCIHVKADSSYVPSLCSTSGGILWLELSGDCWADTGWDEIGHFGGFDTVVITGSGTLTLSQMFSGIQTLAVSVPPVSRTAGTASVFSSVKLGGRHHRPRHPLLAGDPCAQRRRDHRRSAGYGGRRRVRACVPERVMPSSSRRLRSCSQKLMGTPPRRFSTNSDSILTQFLGFVNPLSQET